MSISWAIISDPVGLQLPPTASFKRKPKMKNQSALQRLVTVGFLTAFLAIPGLANSQVRYATGLGAHGCGEYLEYRRTPNTEYDSLLGEWAAGFISGHNWFTEKKQMTRPLPQASILAYLDKGCKDEPLTNIVWHMGKLIKQYENK